MPDSNQKPDDEGSRPSASVEAQIDENLRRLFETELGADLPPKLAELVARLDADALPDPADALGGSEFDAERARFFSHWRQAI